jgi:hypothetical protein
MKSTNELKALVQKWWQDNTKVATPPLARDFKTEIVAEGVTITRCKDLDKAISFRIESGDNYIDGLIVNGTGEIQLKDESHDQNWLNTHHIG